VVIVTECTFEIALGREKVLIASVFTLDREKVKTMKASLL
jgi:hypothetical protein